MIKKPIKKICPCGKAFFAWKADIRRGKARVCSRICANLFRKKGRLVWNKGTKGIIKGPWLGKRLPKWMKEKLSKAKIGKKLSKKHRENIGLAHKGHHRGGWKFSLEIRKKLQIAQRKRWGKVVKKEKQEERKSLDYRLWREAVFRRDDYTCQNCKQRGGKLNADHIKPFSLFPELRLAIDNGRTLCVDCHRKIGWSPYKKKNVC